jgi:hypothetical protein
MTTTQNPQRYEIINWLGGVELYRDESQRDEVADAILASGSTDEADWLAILEQHTA